jgi:rubrerythrin
MTQKETDAADVTLDLLAIQSSALEAIRDYSCYLRNAENAGLPEVAHFVRLLMEEDSARAAHCQGLLRKLGSTGTGRPVSQPAEHRH